MNRNMIETVLGAVVLLVAAGFLFFAYKTADLQPVKGYELTARFNQIEGLETGTDVKISGVKVGTVLGFELDPETYLAVVRLSIDPSIKLSTDTAAVVKSEGLLNGKFLSLEPGANEDYLDPGGRIEFTQSSPSLETLLGQVIFSLTKSDSGNDGN